MIYPPPQAFGLPSHFSNWREGQFEAIQQSLASKQRIVVQNAPTGVGKSLILMGEAAMSGGRSLILTAEKQLQDLYARDFGEVTTDLRGQQNYPCLALHPGGEHYAPYIPIGATVDEGPCHFGEGCSLLLGGCHYYDRARAARLDRTVITNYDLILSVNRYSEGLGHFDLIACDEAHELPEKLASSMSAQVTDWEAKTLIKLDLHPSEDPLYWAQWAGLARARVSRTIEQLKQSSDTVDSRTKLKNLSNIKRSLDQMALADETWVVEVAKDRVKLEPISPAQFLEPYLLAGSKKVVFSSATITSKTLDILGIKDFDFFEYPSPFPLSQRPIWFVPTVKMWFGMPQEDELKWVRAVDQIISQRLDRNIVIHTVSYARQKFLLAHSRYRAVMLANSKLDTAHIIKEFKTSKEPRVLVTPSADTGVDFPGVECETIIIVKVPFPDTSSKLYQARSAQDSEYGPYVAAKTLVQMAGRGMRSVTDRCETIILDSTFGSLKSHHSHLFPYWFLTAVRKSDTIPVPLEKLP